MEAIGLAFSALSFLEMAINVVSSAMDLGSKYRDAGEDLDIVETWLKRHKVALEIWMEFWGLKKDCFDKWLTRLWGPDGKEIITDHLRILAAHTQRASTLHDKYKSRKVGRRLRFRFAFSGKENFESVIELIRVQLETLRSDSEHIFLKMHPSFSRSVLSENAVHSLEESVLAIQKVMYVQQASTAVLSALKSPCMAIDLKLRQGPAGKDVFTLAASGKLKDDAIKLSLTLTANGQREDWPDLSDEGYNSMSVAPPVIHTVVEFDDKCKTKKRRSREIKGVTYLLSSAASQDPAPIPHIYRPSLAMDSPNLIFHGTYAGPDRDFDLDNMRIPKQPLANFFEELQMLKGNKSLLKFPLRDRLDLAYLLAVTVASLHETGWLKKLCSHHVLWGKGKHKKNKHCSVNVTEKGICENEIRTPFDIFRRSSVRVSANIFSLGILLYEIGTGQLIQECERAEMSLKWHPKWHAKRLLKDARNIINAKYATVVETCLRGTFDIDTKEQFLQSYFFKVIDP